MFFGEFNTDSLNLFVSYWYHPPKRWKSMAYGQQVNMEIMRRFDAEGIRLAPPDTTTRWVQENGQADTPLLLATRPDLDLSLATG